MKVDTLGRYRDENAEDRAVVLVRGKRIKEIMQPSVATQLDCCFPLTFNVRLNWELRRSQAVEIAAESGGEGVSLRTRWSDVRVLPGAP